MDQVRTGHTPRHLADPARRGELLALAVGLLLAIAGVLTFVGGDGSRTVGGAALLALAIATGGVLVILRATLDHVARVEELRDALVEVEARADEREAMVSMLADLARRSRTLLDEHLADLDTQLGPDLDRRATRLRRSAEGVIALAEPASFGAASAPWAHDRRGTVALADVVRLALAEVERPSRVRIHLTDTRPVAVSMVPAVAHVLAELIENAPADVVIVRGEPVLDASGAALVVVDDAGVGVSDDALAALNELLAHPRPVDATTRSLGLHVVSRLAQRLGAKVWLAPNPNGGISARVKLPAAVFTAGSGEPTVTVDLDAMPHVAEPVVGSMPLSS
jgi:signal transduction histidine kinase